MRIVALLLVAYVVFAGPARAADPEQQATRLSNEIMSPFCPGVTLHECPSAEALRLRDRIESWFRSGMSREAIWQRLEAEYGTGIRAVPDPSGMGLTAWLVAIGATILALATGTILVRRWSRRAEETASEPLAPVDRTRLDDELTRLRAQL